VMKRCGLQVNFVRPPNLVDVMSLAFSDRRSNITNPLCLKSQPYFPIHVSVVPQLVDGVIVMFYPWLVDEGAATRSPEERPADRLASDNTLPRCDSAIDAIGLFNKSLRVHWPFICRFADF
jgi:hypothetical protein